MSNRFRAVFHHQHVILPVIHVQTEELAIRNAELARSSGCDGVFLINHGVSHEVLLAVRAAVCDALPGFWVGINSLGSQTGPLFNATAVDGIWADDGLIREGCTDQVEAAELLEARRKAGWDGLYFGGVAFKYQQPVNDVANAIRTASDFMDVVVTSGSGTGVAADVERIRMMREASPETPLAIASGITPDNVHRYLPLCDCFMVATGISSSFTKLNREKVQALVSEVRGS